MAKAHSHNSISAFDCDVIREAFRSWVIEDKIPEHEWQERAKGLIHTLTGIEDLDPDMLEWIVRK
ncbi:MULTISPECIES: hypothetical protein [unclassified Mesorhizobium]|uniref:hypothetical protein n=1 Tax=unclassified Mesorhizobium TaxID=325217 RepID=UPI00109393D6|nr:MULTISPECIES: hypothetical protein [unclassified Mesorhizobium]TGT91250.1 hypothetical protein EN804_08000 [Mesorhizobium sp. M8A.F.Ca.ET.161.01.1.1]TGV43470.1 hypothetical protein EN785_05550 [Mesorhizobium sp. M8A.F.Ca.ET.142.01.1.1]